MFILSFFYEFNFSKLQSVYQFCFIDYAIICSPSGSFSGKSNKKIIEIPIRIQSYVSSYECLLLPKLVYVWQYRNIFQNSLHILITKSTSNITSLTINVKPMSLTGRRRRKKIIFSPSINTTNYSNYMFPCQRDIFYHVIEFDYRNLQCKGYMLNAD